MRQGASSLRVLDMSGNDGMTHAAGKALAHMAQVNTSLRSLAFMGHRLGREALEVMRVYHSMQKGHML